MSFRSTFAAAFAFLASLAAALVGGAFFLAMLKEEYQVGNKHVQALSETTCRSSDSTRQLRVATPLGLEVLVGFSLLGCLASPLR